MGIMASIHKKLLGTALKSLARYTPGLLIEKAYDKVKERIDTEIPYPEGRDFVLKMFDVMRKKFPQLSRYVREKAVDVFLIKAEIEGAKKRAALKEKLGYWAPFLFVVSPTMRCNLRCYGCYAGEYTKESDLPWELLDRVMREAKEIGIHFVVISGGEPFMYPHIWDLLEKHNDIFFQMYTNGTMIDKAAAKRIAELGNLLPCISVEGFEEETDRRRGKGHFKRVMAAMDAL
ncbi:MAG: radical SAM protein, partial [Planctomycetota bacterium]